MAIETELTDRTAVVTGAGRGIGREIAYRLAEAGADIVAAARTEAEIAAVADTVEDRYGVDGLAVRTDLRDVEAIDGLIDRAVEGFGAPEILVNNAGVNLHNRALDQTVEELATMVDVNFKAPFLLAQRFGWVFRDSDKEAGSIVNVSSVSGRLGKDFTSVYGGTKAGLYGLTRGLAAGLSRYGIRVNSISPGTTLIERTRDRLDDRDLDIDRVPLSRLGEAADVADVAVFLASDRAGYVTGVDVPVDGGICFTAGLYPHD